MGIVLLDNLENKFLIDNIEFRVWNELIGVLNYEKLRK
jgi:hypothetical protein